MSSASAASGGISGSESDLTAPPAGAWVAPRFTRVKATAAPIRVTEAPIVRPVPSAETKASRTTEVTCAEACPAG